MLTKKPANASSASNTSAKPEKETKSPTLQTSSSSSSSSPSSSQTNSFSQLSTQASKKPVSTPSKSGQKTRITIKYDVGFANSIFVRGVGADLSWNKGIPLKNVKADEWVWETETPFSTCEFKVLINDQHYEKGENHFIDAGKVFTFTPNF